MNSFSCKKKIGNCFTGKKFTDHEHVQYSYNAIHKKKIMDDYSASYLVWPLLVFS